MTWVGDITCIPTWQRGPPRPATVTGLAAPDTKIIGHTMAGHTPHRADRRDPTRGHQGLPTGPWRHGVPAPAAGPRTPRTGYARVMDDHGILPPVGRTGACHTQRGDRPLSTGP